jgi:hypothetical protein
VEKGDERSQRRTQKQGIPLGHRHRLPVKTSKT